MVPEQNLLTKICWQEHKGVTCGGQIPTGFSLSMNNLLFDESGNRNFGLLLAQKNHDRLPPPSTTQYRVLLFS